jgi:hypothetical protein
MSFTTITSGEIASGEPVTSTLQTKIKDNFDDHESRIQDLEGGSATVYPPLIMRVNGPYGYYSAADGILKTTLNFPITVTGVRILVDVAGTSGTLEVDVEYKRGGGSWTTIMTTKPSVAYTAGNDALSSNGVVNASQADLQAGDILRLNIDSIQVAGNGFLVRIDYNRT